MATRITKALQTKLEALQKGGADMFCKEFADWKSGTANVLFGRDAAYRKPKVGVEDYRLMHVHLIPSVNAGDNDLWMKRWREKRERTSDHALVYTADDRGNYLLIAILDEPGAHKVADMRTLADKATMEGFAATAEAFRHDGSIIA